MAGQAVLTGVEHIRPEGAAALFVSWPFFRQTVSVQGDPVAWSRTDGVAERIEGLRSMSSQATQLKPDAPARGNGKHRQLPDWIRDVPPILRWAGGKRQLVRTLLGYLPGDVKERKYHEPFLGAGSLFFRLPVATARLADANEHLIETYRWVARDWRLIAHYLARHKVANSERHYYRVRELYNKSSFSGAQAARFIYLNKTCFNGIFRVNRKGQFNVPYGWKEPPAIPGAASLRAISECLQGAQIAAEPFERSLKRVGEEDFVYLDPPYPALNGTAYFTHYTKDRFGEGDQRLLAELVQELSNRGALFLMTNADTPLVRELYKGYEQVPIQVVRYITCKSTRNAVSELVIRNFS